MTINTADQRAVDKRNKKLKQADLVEDEAVRWMMADEKGRKYLAALVRESQALATQISATEQGGMFREGRKVIGLKIIADVQRSAPKQFALLIADVIGTPETDNESKDDTDGRRADDSE